jgi:hypothetical protein
MESGSISSSRWSDEFLNSMRSVADLETDSLMADLFQSGNVEELLSLRPFLETWDAPITPDIPQSIREFLEKPVVFPDWVDQSQLDRATKVFESYGAVISMMLLLSGFPHSLTNPSEARAFFIAQVLNPKTIKKRMHQLPHFMVRITQRGGLEQTEVPGNPSTLKKGVGILAAQKLRLIHSSIRLRLQLPQPLSENNWDAGVDGQPINQEDLTSAILDFNFWVVAGMRKLGIEISREDEEARFHQWMTTGFLLGVCDAMRPRNIDEAMLLRETISRRRVKASPEGAAVLAELLQIMRSMLPRMYRSLPAGMLRYLLDKKTADMLQVPNPLLLVWLLRVLAPFFKKERIFAKITRLISPPLVRWLNKI